MSVGVMAWVWKHSQSKPVQRLVLLAIADCANDRGAEAYPANATLAKKTGLSERGVRKAVSELEELGELRVAYKAGPKGCNRYSIVMRDPAPDAGSHPAQHAGSSAVEASDPEHGAGSDDTRHNMPGAPRARSTRHVVPGTRHETSSDPAPRAPKPSKNHPPTEPSKESSELRPDVERICAHLADRIESNGSKRPKVTDRWRTAGRLLLDTDGRTVDQVIKAIDWCQADSFWMSNILSMPKLREKYDQLRLAAQNRGGSSSGHKPFKNPTDPSAYEGEL